jgi:hypothetical protein
MVAYVRRDDPEVDAFNVFWEPDNEPEYVVVGSLGSGCARRAATVIDLLTPWLDAPDPNECKAALYAVACWLGLARGDVPIPAQALRRLTAVATDSAAEPEVRIDCVLGLAAVGTDTSELLDDASVDIRTCAALSAAVAAQPRALQVITAALTGPVEWDYRLRPVPPVPFAHATLGARLAEAAIRCADDFEQLLPAALGVAAAAKPWSMHDTWGPMLAAAFPHPPETGRPLGTAQRAYLSAIAANDAIWDDQGQERDELLRRLGLPIGREAIRSLALR